MSGAEAGPRAARRTSALLFLALVAVYSANGREVGAIDTIPNVLLPVAVVRGDGLVLNRFGWMVRDHFYVKERNGDLISRYPVLPALVAVPATWLQVAALDRAFPGWTGDAMVAYWWIRTIAKNAAVLVAALTAVLLHRLLVGLGLGAVALPATLAAALGSNLWMVASQSPWLHGTVALFLTAALWLLAPVRAPGPARLAGGGLALALAVCARPTSAVFALPIAGWAVLALGRRALWLLVPAGAVGVWLVAHNAASFDSLLGGMGEIEAAGHAKHGVEGAVTREPWTSFAGTLLSPSRGLLVFSPWVALALAALPATARRIAAFPVLRAAELGLALFFVVNGSYAVWWGGWSFGPRYWTEAMPLFGVLLGFALDEARSRAGLGEARGRAGLGAARSRAGLGSRRWRALLAAFGLAIAAGVAIQALGAFTYPSSWNSDPVTVDLAHERLWDWRDSELTRALREGPHWPASYELLARALRE